MEKKVERSLNYVQLSSLLFLWQLVSLSQNWAYYENIITVFGRVTISLFISNTFITNHLCAWPKTALLASAFANRNTVWRWKNNSCDVLTLAGKFYICSSVYINAFSLDRLEFIRNLQTWNCNGSVLLVK